MQIKLRVRYKYEFENVTIKTMDWYRTARWYRISVSSSRLLIPRGDKVSVPFVY